MIRFLIIVVVSQLYFNVATYVAIKEIQSKVNISDKNR